MNRASIKIKRDLIIPLYKYFSELNDFSHRSHRITFDSSKTLIKIFEGIKKDIAEKEKKEREGHKWHYASSEIVIDKNNCKEFLRVFKSLKTIMRAEPDTDLELSFF